MDDISVRLQTTNSVQQLTRSPPSHKYSKSQLQYSLQKARTFSRFTNNQQAQIQEQNEALQRASKSYANIRVQRIYKRSAPGQQRTKNKYASPHYNPEAAQTIQLFKIKAGYMPGYRDKFQEGFGQKMALQHRQSELKRLINEQRKVKDKVLLRNCKLMNALQNSDKNTKILKDQSRQNLLLICFLASQCNNSDLELNQMELTNEGLSNTINEEQNRLSQLKTAVTKIKIVLDQKLRRLNQLKSTYSIESKKMVNLQSLLNQMKKEKALLMNRVIHVDQYS